MKTQRIMTPRTVLFTFVLTLLAYLVPFEHAWPQSEDCKGKPAQTTGLFCNQGAYEGYTLFSVLRGMGVYLIDNKGNLLWQWQEPDKLNGVKILLTDKGTLIRNLCHDTEKCRGNGALIREYDWDNNIIWQYYHPGAHHDIVQLPDGRLLLAVVLDDGTESLIKVKPNYQNWNRDWRTIQPGEGGSVEWEWRLRDHLVPDGEDPANYPELFHDAHYKRLNALDFHPQRNEILMSFNSFNELIVIKDSDSREIAATAQGHIHYRWGNPGNYNSPGEIMTSGQHSSRWIKASEFGYRFDNNSDVGVGDILWFNNLHDRVDQIRPPLKGDRLAGNYFLQDSVFGPNSTNWSYDFDGKFDDGRQSSAQRLPNGNTLIAFSNQGTFIEITPSGEIVWKFVSPFCTIGEGSEPKTIPDYVREWNEKSCEESQLLAIHTSTV
ncbi:MAG: aryl-sulfate sulfotransferase [Pseudomonadota bacterium]